MSGADWEWWFLQPSSAFGAAVQAKSLKDRAYDIAYKPKNGRVQIEMLIRYCKTHGVSPQYCFYNFWDSEPVLSRIWPCASVSPDPALWGCAIADGSAIWEVHRSKAYTTDIIVPICTPWHCLVCCPGIFTPASAGKGPATRAHGFSNVLRDRALAQIKERFPERRRQSRRIRPPVLMAEPPERIRSLMEIVQQQIHPSRDEILRMWDGQPPPFVLIIGNQQQFEL